MSFARKYSDSLSLCQRSFGTFSWSNCKSNLERIRSSVILISLSREREGFTLSIVGTNTSPDEKRLLQSLIGSCRMVSFTSQKRCLLFESLNSDKVCHNLRSPPAKKCDSIEAHCVAFNHIDHDFGDCHSRSLSWSDVHTVMSTEGLNFPIPNFLADAQSHFSISLPVDCFESLFLSNALLHTQWAFKFTTIAFDNSNLELKHTLSSSFISCKSFDSPVHWYAGNSEMKEADDPHGRNRKMTTMPHSVALARGDGAGKRMVYLSYCGFHHKIDLESTKEGGDVKTRNSQVIEDPKIHFQPKTTSEGSPEKKDTENHIPIPTPLKISKITGLNHRNEFYLHSSIDNKSNLEKPENSHLILSPTMKRPKTTQLNQRNEFYLHPSTASVSNLDKGLPKNQNPIPGPTSQHQRTQALNHRNERTKTIDKPSKGLVASTALWLSGRARSAVIPCRNALRWVRLCLFRR